MCGIAAIFAYRSDAPSVDEGELTAIRDHMTSRGPDGAGNWFDTQRRVGLGHRRLAIIDLSEAGAQPMLWPERKLAITFNGEIYNYRALRAALEQKGHVFKSSSDTEVLLHLYAEHGDGMVNELRGMYTFAIWDGAKPGLFLARDPFGIKPLYVADDGKTLRLASQVKALLAGSKIDTAPEPAGHVGFFLWGHVPEPFTLYRGIRSLPAGTTLWVGQNGERRERAFCSITEILADAKQSPHRLPRREPEATLAHRIGEGLGVRASGGRSLPFSRLSATLPPSDEERATVRRALGNALRDSVAHHLIADVAVGVFLSSGLDSTTLAALAAEQGGRLRTVTLGFEEFRGTANDEVPLAEIVAKQYSAQHQTIWVSRADFVGESERLLAAMDQPSTDGVNTYFVSLAAKRAGLKVALSGLGGDELFAGYPSFNQVPRMAGALKFLPPGSGFGKAFRVVSAPLLKHFTSSKYAGLLEYGGDYGGAYLLRRGMFMPWELPEILDPDLVREGWKRLNTLSGLSLTTQSLNTDRLKVSALELCWYMRNQLLRDSDWAGMAHSLEIRVPLVDLTLLRTLAPSLASATPPTKLDMARSPASPLPSAVLNRLKTGFQIPVRDWLRAESPESKVQSPKSAERGLRGWAKQIYGQFARGRTPHATPPRRTQTPEPAPA